MTRSRNPADAVDDGMKRILSFLDKLDNEGVHSVIDQRNAQCLTVTFTLVGTRVAADFYPDRTEYRHYAGSEDVHDDRSALERLLGPN